MALVRGLVSKKKKRFVQDGFNLDLSYITPRIIAMGFPSTGVEAVYRNPMPEVQRFFKHFHDDHFKIYNLCSERAYDLESYFPLVERVPFNDHNPCAFDQLGPFCASVDAFLAADPKNVVAIHCKAGKGRTGLTIATYMLHSKVCESADAALQKFAEERTMNKKGARLFSLCTAHLSLNNRLRGVIQA
jgi:phosphatidylinositol-3,4,5-trisphosphate 3-phosphatase/dual-specificity protein phosphatase PTEN